MLWTHRTTAFSLGFLALALAGCNVENAHHEERQEIPHLRDSQSIELDKSAGTRVEINMGAGELEVSGGSSKLAEADFSYDGDDSKPVMHYNSSPVRGTLSIMGAGGTTAARDGGHWDIRLNDKRPMEISTTLGAGQARMNLGTLDLTSVKVDIGAGQVNLDLRGNPKHDYDVEVHGGVGEAIIRLPKTVAIKASATGGIGGIDVQGLEKHGSRWINPGHEDAAVTIHVEVSGGVGHIMLSAE